VQKDDRPGKNRKEKRAKHATGKLVRTFRIWRGREGTVDDVPDATIERSVPTTRSFCLTTGDHPTKKKSMKHVEKQLSSEALIKRKRRIYCKQKGKGKK
jgi:hypothetical protein